MKMGEPRTFHMLTEEELHALATLQDKMVSAPIIAIPRSKGHMILETDAGDM